MNVNQMSDSKYLKQADIEGEVIVTIVRVGQGNVAKEGEPEELKWLVKFKEFKKAMVLNSTNIQLLAKACGSDETDDWPGKEVILYVDDNVSFQGKLVGGIRVKSMLTKLPPKRPGRTVADLDDDVPWVDH